MLTRQNFDYELIDCGFASRLERFGNRVLDRPCPQALWESKDTSLTPTIIYERDGNQGVWQGIQNLSDTWDIQVGHITAHLKFSPNGQVGIFPEQFDNWQWIEQQVTRNADRPLKILNTFAYTGMASLFASQSHTEVCHVDGAKSAINWAKHNAKLSGLDNNHLRWICDDVQKFIEREIKRGHTYDGIILDPPAFGRGAKTSWKIERDLEGLMHKVSQILSSNPLFVILTCHAPEHFEPRDLARILEKLPAFSGQTAEELVLKIPSKEGHPLASSFGARIVKG